jgi:hypothetical protein
MFPTVGSAHESRPTLRHRRRNRRGRYLSVLPALIQLITTILRITHGL